MFAVFIGILLENAKGLRYNLIIGVQNCISNQTGVDKVEH